MLALLVENGTPLPQAATATEIALFPRVEVLFGTGYTRPQSLLNPPANSKELFELDKGPCSLSPTAGPESAGFSPPPAAAFRRRTGIGISTGTSNKFRDPRMTVVV